MAHEKQKRKIAENDFESRFFEWVISVRLCLCVCVSERVA